jgi:hypothetical protein
MISGAMSRGAEGERMNDRILPYLISLGLIGAGVIWIVAGTNSASAAIWITIGGLTIAVGAMSLLSEYHNRTH